MLRYAHLLLLSAERSWAQAMQVKTTHSAESSNRTITGSTKKYILSKLHKSTVYSERLLSLCQEIHGGVQDTVDVIEARAYHSSLFGSISFEKSQWEEALQNYTEARFLYTYVARSTATKQEGIFTDLISGTLDPNIRYAAYQLGLSRTTSIDSIVSRYVSQNQGEVIREVLKKQAESEGESVKTVAAEGSRTGPKTIQWRSRTVAIEDAATGQALGAVSSAESSLSSFLAANPTASRQAKASEYDQVLIPSQDAVDTTRTAIDELSAEGVPQSDPRIQSLQITRTAVNYALISWRIGRNRVLCGNNDGCLLEPIVAKSKKHSKDETNVKSEAATEESSSHKIKRLKQRIVLYDASIQSIDSIQDLPGIAADQALLKELDAKRKYFASLRCLAIARSHSLIGHTKEALAMLSRALDQASTASNNLPSFETSANKPLNIEVSSTQASKLKDLLQGTVFQYRALVELQNLEAATSKAAAGNVYRPLVERLAEYPIGEVDLTKLVTYPPKLEPVPVKPIFLDLAYNYIDYPGRGPKSAEKNVHGMTEKAMGREEKKEGRKGWFGFGR